MLIKTRYFGNQEVDPRSILFFPEGFAGFEECHRFKLFHEQTDQPVIHFLQSLDEPGLAFSVVIPRHLGLGYDLPLSSKETSLLKTTNWEELLILVLLISQQEADGPRVRPSIEHPLLINPESRRGLQIHLRPGEYELSPG